MFKNYCKTAIRNLRRYKGSALINIASLGIGMISCLAISLFIRDEKQYDQFIRGGENIYRIYGQQSDHDRIALMVPVPPVYAGFLQGYPEVESRARILMAGGKYLVELDDTKNYEEKGWYVDSTFFAIFPLKFLRGNPATALREPATVVISEDMARRYFGTGDPLGKTIKIDNKPYTISGVLEKLPAQFHLDFHYLMPLSAAMIPAQGMESREWNPFYTYASSPLTPLPQTR
jgi:putative ABC transport system permease protein